MATAEDNLHFVLNPEIEFQLSDHVSLIGTCAGRLVKTPLLREWNPAAMPSAFPVEPDQATLKSKSIATRRTMLAAVQQTGSLDQRVRHVGDAASLRDAQNTDRYLAGGGHTLAL
jgi:hypothetical protein